MFAVEYLARVWVADLKPEYQRLSFPRLRYMLSPLAIADLLAILPFFTALIDFDLRFVRLLRLFRLVRVMKLGRYSTAMQTIGRILSSKKEELVVAVSIVLSLLVFASTIIYLVENEAQPEAFGSIPETMWWGIATLTTIGYGDVYPVTGLGKFFGGIIAIFCLGLFALPAGIVAGGFSEELQKRRQQEEIVECPSCGAKISQGGKL